MSNADIPDSIRNQFENINKEIDEDIFNAQSQDFIEDMDNIGNETWSNRNLTAEEMQNQIEAEETAELQAEESELQSFLNEQTPLDQEEAESFLNDIDEIVPEEEGVPEIEFGETTETTPFMEGEETRFSQLESRTYAPSGEAGTVGEVEGAEAVETGLGDLAGFEEIAIETDSLLAGAGEAAGEIAGEMTEMAISSSLEYAAGVVGEGALAAVSGAAALLSPALAVGVVVMGAIEIANVVNKYNENEQTKEDYRSKVLSTYSEMNQKNRQLAEYLNSKAKFEATYQDNMYKWIYGWKDPENYPEGRGYQLQEFKYKNDWSDGWSMKKKLAKTAELLGTNWANIAKTGWWSGRPSTEKDDELEEQLKSIYSEVNYSKKFREYLQTQFAGNVIASVEDKNEIYKVNQLLMTKDGRILNHYQRQAESDPKYRESLTKMTNAINVKRSKFGLKPISEHDVEYATNRDKVSSAALREGVKPSVPFWALYYKKNKSAFRRQDAKEMNDKYILWLKRGKKAIKHKVTQEELDYQNSFFMHKDTHKQTIHGRDMGEIDEDYSNVIIDRDGMGGDSDEVTFFRKRRRKKTTPTRRRPPRDIPKPDEKTPSGETMEGTEYIDVDASFNPEKENVFDKDYYFSIDMATKLCHLCSRAYDPPVENEEEEGYDIVEFMGDESIASSAQGRMFASKKNKVIVIVYRGTDFSRMVNRPDLAVSDIIVDLDAKTQLDEVTGLHCHEGFLNYFYTTYEQVSRFVTENYEDDYVIYTSGHSLASVPSMLCSMYLNKMLEDRVCINYTFGSPRGFIKSEESRANALLKPCYRIADTYDYISGLPPKALDGTLLAEYYHVGELHAIESQWALKPSFMKSDVLAKMIVVTDKDKADVATGTSLPNFTFHLLNHYLMSLNYLQLKQKTTGESFRTEAEMVEKGHITHQSSIPANPGAHKTILNAQNHSYKHTGRYYGNKLVYQQSNAEHLEFIPNYHSSHGLSMTPIPSNLKQAIVGVYMYKEDEFKSQGAVKAFVVY